jgi:hypothetical protein
MMSRYSREQLKTTPDQPRPTLKIDRLVLNDPLQKRAKSVRRAAQISWRRGALSRKGVCKRRSPLKVINLSNIQ